ncbi:hypothetical protein ACR9HQ_13320 [Enterobacter ludwigii]
MENKTILNSTLITAYALFISISYLWGFWGHFDINILNYISVSDIIKSAIWPMIIALAMYLIQVAMNNYNGPRTDISVKYSEMEKGEKFDYILRYSYAIIMACLVLASVIYNLITGNKMIRYAAIGWILASIVFFTTSRNKDLMAYIPFKNKALFYSIFCFLPVFFLSRGVFEGDKILAGENTFLVESDSLCSSKENDKYRYIDVMADKAFALSLKDKSICIFKFENLKLIRENKS